MICWIPEVLSECHISNGQSISISICNPWKCRVWCVCVSSSPCPCRCVVSHFRLAYHDVRCGSPSGLFRSASFSCFRGLLRDMMCICWVCSIYMSDGQVALFSCWPGCSVLQFCPWGCVIRDCMRRLSSSFLSFTPRVFRFRVAS